MVMLMKTEQTTNRARKMTEESERKYRVRQAGMKQWLRGIPACLYQCWTHHTHTMEATYSY